MRQDKTVRYILFAAASISLCVIVLILLFLGREAVPFLIEPGLGSFLNFRWMPVSFQKPSFGVYPLFVGSVLVTVIGILISVPLSLVAALYLSELARDKEREFIKPFIEILAGVPSVVIGFFGLITVAPIVKSIFGLQTGLNAMTGAVVLGLMSMPTIITLAEDAIRSVPQSYKQASLALGANRLETLFRVIFPAALPGIMAAIMLGVGRVIGETMAVLMVTGNAALTTVNPFESVRTMTATIAAEMGEVAVGSEHYRSLFCVGVVLLFMSLGINRVGQYFLRKNRVGS